MRENIAAEQTNYSGNPMRSLMSSHLLRTCRFSSFVPRRACHPAAAQCAACTNSVAFADMLVSVSSSQNSNIASIPAVESGLGRFTLQIAAAAGATMPVNFPAGRYQAWCGTYPGVGFASPGTWTATVNAGNATPPLGADILPLINYILNHKQGTVEDVQEAIWRVLGTRTTDFLIASHFDLALNMYNDAVQYGATFKPDLGQKMAIVLLSPSIDVQNMLVEMINCGAIGDRVWVDTASDGLQNRNVLVGYSEAGINGVTVKLLDPANGDAEVASTMTGPLPLYYSFNPTAPKAAGWGWYQFTGIDCNKSYRVFIDKSQPVLANMTAIAAGVGTDPAANSKGVAYTTAGGKTGVAATVPVRSSNPAIDETIDFGFSGSPAPGLYCPTPYGFAGAAYSSAMASGGTAPYNLTTTGLPGWLTLSSAGVLSGMPPAASAFHFTATVAGTAETVTCTINFQPAPVVVSACPAASAQSGVPYSYSIAPVVSGGTAPYRYLITAGSLGSDLLLDPLTGMITGTPANAGSLNLDFTLTVVDSLGMSGAGSTINASAQSCRISVAPPPPALACPTPTALNATLYSASLVASGGTGAYTKYEITSGNLPPGVTLNPSTGVISGTPTSEGSYSFAARVTDSAGATGTTPAGACPLTVGPKFTVSCPAVTTGAAGALFTSSATINGGAASSYTFTKVNGPDWMTVAANGAVTGTPSAGGVVNFSVQAKDSGVPATIGTSPVCSLQIALSATCPSNLTGVTGMAYNGAMTGVGGSGTYTFSNVAGLPPGLMMSSTGAISGTPTTAGAHQLHGYGHGFDRIDGQSRLHDHDYPGAQRHVRDDRQCGARRRDHAGHDDGQRRRGRALYLLRRRDLPAGLVDGVGRDDLGDPDGQRRPSPTRSR